MKDLKEPNYVNLGKEFYNIYQRLKEETLNLREKLFGEANKKLKVYEEEIKEEFLEVWNKYGNSKIIFNNFKICLDPQNNCNCSLIKTLTVYGEKLDLEKIAGDFPEKERKHDELISNKKYREISEKMIEVLRKERLYSRHSEISEIREYREKFNILSFEPKYYE